MTKIPLPAILDSIDTLDRTELERLNKKVEMTLLASNATNLHDVWFALMEVTASKGIPMEHVRHGYRKFVVAAHKQFAAIFKKMRPRPDRRQRIMIYRIGVEQAMRRIEFDNTPLTIRLILETLGAPGGAASILDDAFPGYALSIFRHLNHEARHDH